MHFELVGEITEVEAIASGRGIRNLARLRRRYGASRWRTLRDVVRVRIAGGRIRGPRGIGTKPTALGECDEDRAILRLMAATRPKRRYLLCVRNKGCEDLELPTLCEQRDDPPAAEDGYVRVVDEAGEDYLYPSDCFVAVDLPREAERALAGEVR